MVPSGDFGGNEFSGEAKGGHSGLWHEHVSAATYKKKKAKIRPLDQVTDGEGTGSDPVYVEKCQKLETYQKDPFNMWMTRKFSTIERRSRLTAERLEEMDIGAELGPKE